MRDFLFHRRGVLAAIAAVAVAAGGASASTEAEAPVDEGLRLIMVEQPGCAYCAAWDDEIAPAYGRTDEGRYAPLARADLRMGPPDGVEYDREVRFTPTFVLVRDGQEIARMEGYVGQDFFWPLYLDMLERNTAFQPDAP
ncbi:thioredoxin family protein [Citreimonas sp.]|uniref:thioredoxin family protein n=1 Tax=Citreimonas sp. TaxID=3036715 RepID=UPI00405A2F49